MTMPRQRVSRPGNVAAIRKYFRETQDQRSAILELFVGQLREEALLDEVKTNDDLFAATLRLAAEEYGVRFQDVAERIGMSPAAVGRWSKQVNLPTGLMRPLVVAAIADLIEAYIKTSAHGRNQKDDLGLKRGVLVH